VQTPRLYGWSVGGRVLGPQIFLNAVRGPNGWLALVAAVPKMYRLFGLARETVAGAAGFGFGVVGWTVDPWHCLSPPCCPGSIEAGSPPITAPAWIELLLPALARAKSTGSGFGCMAKVAAIGVLLRRMLRRTPEIDEVAAFRCHVQSVQ
jgi:hypothetical protein